MGYQQNSANTMLGEYLMSVGVSYLQDAQMIMKVHYSESYASRLIKQMKADGDLAIVELTGSNKKKVKAVTLTKSGRIKMLDTLNEEYWYEHSLDAKKDFRTSNEEKVITMLNGVRALTMFACTSTPSLPKDKPSLPFMYNALIRHNKYGIKEVEYAPEQLKKTYGAFTEEECAEMISKSGVYYTLAEYREFCNLTEPGLADTFHGARARGIFISMTNCYIVYVAQHGNNKMMKLGKFETALLASLRRILRLTRVERVIEPLTRKLATQYNISNVKTINNAPHALVITDGDSLVYSMVMGAPNGIMRSSKKTKKKKQDEKDAAFNMAFLDYETLLYPRVFATPFSVNGINSLEYICHTSAEAWIDDTREVCRNFKGTFVVSHNNPYYPAREDKQGGLPTIFLPAYEIKELRKISEMDYPVAIITYRDMLNAIAHSIRKQVNYYDADTASAIDRDDVYMYEKTGEMSGKLKIENALKAKGIKATAQEIISLPKKFNYDNYIRFFNGIARNEIQIETFIDFIEAKPIEEKETKQIRRKSMTLTMGTQFINKIYRAAKYNNMSASAYVKQIIHDRVIKDEELYTKKLEENKKRWNNS